MAISMCFAAEMVVRMALQNSCERVGRCSLAVLDDDHNLKFGWCNRVHILGDHH